MSGIYLNPRGRSSYGIGLCDRCRKKFFLGQLAPDANSPGLMVCAADRDVLDPWRLPARETEDISLAFVRPDESIATNPSGVISEDGDEFLITEDGESFLLP